MFLLFKYNWTLLVVSEAFTWISASFFIFSRYKFGLLRLSRLFLGGAIFCTLFQGILACINYYYSGTVSIFQISIFLLIIYGCTFGKHDFKKLDQFLQKKLGQERSGYHGDMFAYIKRRRRNFILHTAVIFIFYSFFAGANKLLMILFSLWLVVYLFEVIILFIYSVWLWKNRYYS